MNSDPELMRAVNAFLASERDGAMTMTGNWHDAHPYLAHVARGNAAIMAERVLHGQPGREEFGSEDIPDEPGCMEIYYDDCDADDARVAVWPEDGSVCLCDSAMEALRGPMHHDQARRLAHLILYAAGIAREGEEA